MADRSWYTKSAAAVAAALAVLLAPPALAGGVRFVDDDASPGGDGLTWKTAHRFLQDALGASAPGLEIRVAGGVYRPDQDEANPAGTGDRDASFALLEDVALRGGYLGLAAGDLGNPDQRDIVANESLLLGDLAGDDGPDFENIGENSHHVLTADGVGPGAALDGFTVRGGNAEGAASTPLGAAILNRNNAAPIVMSCTFVRNYVRAIHNDTSSPTIIDCAFNGNFGGGIGNVLSDPQVSGCTFTENWSIAHGGAVANALMSDASYSDCTFTDNYSLVSGGAFACLGGSSPTVVDCVFTSNSSVSGGAVRNDTQSSPTFVGCTFTANTAEDVGGAFHSDGAMPTLTDCVFDGNQAMFRGGAVSGGAAITSSVFTANDSPVGGGLSITLDSVLSGCTIDQNDGGLGGGVYHESGVLTLDGCTLSGNVAARGGALHTAGGPVLTECAFDGNAASLEGGAVYALGGTDLQRCTISANSASEGGGVFLESGGTIADCTFTANLVTVAGGGLFARGAAATIRRSIFQANPAGLNGAAIHLEASDSLVENSLFSDNGSIAVFCDQGSDATIVNSTFSRSTLAAIAGDGGSQPLVANSILWGNTLELLELGGASIETRYCNIQTGIAGIGNIAADPMFVDPDGRDDTIGTADDDFRLAAGSPSIDAADNGALDAAATTDLDENPRFVDDPATPDTGAGDPPLADMGAYEFQGGGDCPADLNDDGEVDVQDLVMLVLDWGLCPGCATDLNGDGEVDVQDMVQMILEWGACTR